MTPARFAVRRCIWRESQPVRSKSWARRGEDFQIGPKKEEERDAADLILYFKTSSSQDASCCSRISQSGRLVENDARDTVFSYDAVTCGLDRGRVDLTRAEYFPTRDATTSSRTIVGQDGVLEPKTNVRTDCHPQSPASPLRSPPKINGPHHHRHRHR